MTKTPHPLKNLLPILLLIAAAPFVRAAEGAPEEMSIIETILHGGPLIVMIWICILGTSVVLIMFTIQLFLTLRVENLAPKALVDSLTSTISAGNYQETWEICKANKKVYIANVLGGALERLGRGKDAVETALIEYGQREGQILKTKISYISVIGVIAPMIGLLGTVIGMMGAFAVLGSSGVADPRGLALRIGEVLMATASGLFIAIPAFIFYYYFRNLATIVLVESDDKLNRLIEDIPFEELQGIHIGENYEPAPARTSAAAGLSQKVSLTDTNCPVCGGAIAAGQTPCPHCGSVLEWG
ncbi:MAG: MotA/TolQ/ExbB proton channel family protein [Verrucomicrobiota bacterium]